MQMKCWKRKHWLNACVNQCRQVQTAQETEQIVFRIERKKTDLRSLAFEVFSDFEKFSMETMSCELSTIRLHFHWGILWFSLLDRSYLHYEQKYLRLYYANNVIIAVRPQWRQRRSPFSKKQVECKLMPSMQTKTALLSNNKFIS